MDKRLLKKDEQEFLKNYKPQEYDRPSVTTDILVFTTEKKRLQILLIKRGVYPYKDCWAIPGGFIQMDEDAETGAKRELFEETGISDVHIEQHYTFSNPERDPRMRIISISYIATVPKVKIAHHKSGDDAKQSGIFDIFFHDGKINFVDETDELIVTEDEIAFDHIEIIKMAIERMKGKIDYTDLAFEFLNNPQKFTLNELRDIYSAVTEKKYDVGNFRKKIIEKYTKKTQKIKSLEIFKHENAKGRPSEYWRKI